MDVRKLWKMSLARVIAFTVTCDYFDPCHFLR